MHKPVFRDSVDIRNAFKCVLLALDPLSTILGLRVLRGRPWARRGRWILLIVKMRSKWTSPFETHRKMQMSDFVFAFRSKVPPPFRFCSVPFRALAAKWLCGGFWGCILCISASRVNKNQFQCKYQAQVPIHHTNAHTFPNLICSKINILGAAPG